jgi:competence protein ComEA
MMFKKLLLVLAASLLSLQMAFAAVELNKADVAALSAVKGIGPVLSEQIVAERKSGGDYKDWDDLEARVKGIANKKAVQLSKEGVTVDGKKRRGQYQKSDAQAAKEAAKK